MSSQEFPTTFEMSFISTTLNSTMLLALLWGLYTLVYFGTLYAYCNKKSSRHWAVIGAISVLYFAFSAYTIISWYLTQHEFIYDAETRETLFEALIAPSTVPEFTSNLLVSVMTGVADGVLVGCKLIRGGVLMKKAL
ncbi:hypothetical protein CVT26_000345 [Gymnopilus dilepis]|uniref:Uncharacterized protein n=1 Tax=Gymnopilus dilepis TaxID=231916 RepID=A0A409VHI8_9AGAR|nr:hypothetical protein CVT26_000345 [Gymnopilus dilepis]